jgi:DNA-binding NarL/FixJ family response regulator
MTKPTRIEVNCETGEQIEIELTAAEIAQQVIDQAKAKADQEALEAEATAKATARASALSKLAALGLTETEIAAL